MRITILGGFLGAGKTTLLNRILASEHARDAVVLVNDFGAVSIDSHLVVARASRLITLANGCICCSIGSNFVSTLIGITRQPSLPRRLIIEASGVADPAAIAEFAQTDPRFALEAVLVLVDAASIRSLFSDLRIGDLVRRQLAAADLIVLNKLDLVPDSEVRDLANWLGRQCPRRPVLRVRDADVPLAMLFDVVPARTARRATAVSPDSALDAAFESFCFDARRPFDACRLASAIESLPAGVLRGKGLLRLAGDEEGTRVLQIVGPRWSLTPAEDLVGDQCETQLVFIGLKGQLKPDVLQRLLSAALVHAAGP